MNPMTLRLGAMVRWERNARLRDIPGAGHRIGA
jgi:hypothetical protein